MAEGQGVYKFSIFIADPIYSIRGGLYHRAQGVKKANTMIWFWTGTDEEYNTLISTL
jgi:hypothetical protein